MVFTAPAVSVTFAAATAFFVSMFGVLLALKNEPEPHWDIQRIFSVL